MRKQIINIKLDPTGQQDASKIIDHAVTAEVSGPFAIYRTVECGLIGGMIWISDQPFRTPGCWAIGHIPTGYLIARANSKKQALRFLAIVRKIDVPWETIELSDKRSRHKIGEVLKKYIDPRSCIPLGS